MKILRLALLAWVIWKLDVAAHRWEYVDAHNTMKECQAALRGANWDKDVKQLSANQVERSGIRLFCVPDTVDPRPRS